MLGLFGVLKALISLASVMKTGTVTFIYTFNVNHLGALITWQGVLVLDQQDTSPS